MSVIASLVRDLLSDTLRYVDATSFLLYRSSSWILSAFPWSQAPQPIYPPSPENVIVITGASSGLGHSMTIYFARLGYTVIPTMRREEDAAALLAYDPSISPRMHPRILDVSHVSTIALMVADILDEADRSGWRIIALINNAGIGHALPAELTPPSEMEIVMRTNFLGPVELTRLLISHLRAVQGRIINIGSVAGTITAYWYGAYSASKAALRAWNDGLRREMAPWSVSVSILEPGSIASPGPAKVSNAFSDHFRAGPIRGYSPAALAHLFSMAPSTAIPASHIDHAVHDAISSPFPKTRYIVGWDARFIILLTSLGGHALIDPLLSFLFMLWGMRTTPPASSSTFFARFIFLSSLLVAIIYCYLPSSNPTNTELIPTA